MTIATLADGTIGFGTEWGIGKVDINELIDTAESIDGLLFVRLKYVVRYKTIRGSMQDRLHLKALKHSGLFD